MSERSLQIPKTFGNPIPDATEHDSAVGVMPFPSFGNTLPGLSVGIQILKRVICITFLNIIHTRFG